MKSQMSLPDPGYWFGTQLTTQMNFHLLQLRQYLKTQPKLSSQPARPEAEPGLPVDAPGHRSDEPTNLHLCRSPLRMRK